MASERILICGLSARAAAESAARAGLSVTTLDAFADLDQHEGVRAMSLPRDFGRGFTAASAAAAARPLDCDAVAYLSPFENHPRDVQALARGRVLLGNPPAILARVRNPQLVAEALRTRGLPALRVRTRNDPDESIDPADPSAAWMVKPFRSGGGNRVGTWSGGRVPRSSYLQEQVRGIPGSLVFVAAGGQIVPLGISRQLIGDAAFGASGYRYCGSILASPADALFERAGALLETACSAARAIAEEFDLVGVNGIDFVAVDGVPYVVEVNPRWTASMELVERAGVRVFRAHASACSTGELPRLDRPAIDGSSVVLGKAVVFARSDAVAGDTAGWLSDGDVRDVPRCGERIAAGRPVCTVLASGRDAAECHAALVRRARRIYEQLEAPR